MIEKVHKSDSGSNYHVPSLERALLVLELLGQNREGITLSGIVESLGLPKNSIFRITATLLENGYLSRNADDKKNFLTRKLLSIGSSAVCEYSLVEKSFDLMCQLRDQIKETVLIGTIAQNKIVVMEQAIGIHPFKFMLDIGSIIPLNAAAPAKAIMAYLPGNQLEELLGVMEFIKFNKNTITTASGFRKALHQVHQNGFSLDRAEQLDGVNCIGAPIFDRNDYPVASIWTTGPSDRLEENLFDDMGKKIVRYANRISERLK